MTHTENSRDRLGRMMDEGLISAESVADMALSFLSVADVEEMCRMNEIDLDLEEEDEIDLEEEDEDEDEDGIVQSLIKMGR